MVQPSLNTGLPSLPVTGEDVASFPREERRSVKKLGEYIWKQYQDGLAARQHHAVAWIMVKSFLKGIHYFEVSSAGAWKPIPPGVGEIRSTIPVLMPMYRHVLGFLNSNELGMSVYPLAGSSKPIYKAERARDILSSWQDEIRMRDFFDRANQYLLTEGMVGYHPYVDFFRKQVLLRPLAGSELFPIPFDSKSPSETHGEIHATVVTKQWLELQDNLFEKLTGAPPKNPMAREAGRIDLNMRTDLPFVGNYGRGGKFEGAVALTVWMRKNEDVPSGEYLFMINRKVFRHIVGFDENGEPKTRFVMPNGEIPIEHVYFDQSPSDFWGSGLCETQIPAQLSIDRQMTSAERNARENKGLLFVNPNSIDIKDIQSEESPAIPMKLGGYDIGDRRRMVEFFPPTPLGRDAYALIELGRSFADHAAGFRSGIPFGIQEGRTESGPATGLLSQNAMSSLHSVMIRITEALNRVYPVALDLIRMVWPAEKVIKIVGPDNVGRELTVQKDQIPWSNEVVIKSSPMFPGGRQTLANILFQLRSIPGSDGKVGTEISSEELRDGLRKLNLLPPGVKSSSRAESRIRTRIALLVNDGVKPATPPADPRNPADRMVMENHRLAVDLLKDIILDESYMFYSKEVKLALLNEIQFHRNYLFGATESPGDFDDDTEKLAMQQLEDFLSAEEADLMTEQGDFVSEIGV